MCPPPIQATLSVVAETGTIDGTSDFTLMVGDSEPLSQTFTVTVGDNPRDGPNGSLTATLSLPTPSTELVISTGTAMVTINDDDDPAGTFTVENEQASETADNIVFTARLSEASDFTVTVAYATGTMGTGSDPAEAGDFDRDHRHPDLRPQGDRAADYRDH